MGGIDESVSLVVDENWVERVVDLWEELKPRVVVVPGGRTPVPLFERLRKSAEGLHLDSAEFFLSDERCVPPSHMDSNFGRAYRLLFSEISTTAHRMRSESCDPSTYEAALGRRTIDLALLGLGADGHTASLFPGDPAVELDGPSDPLVAVVEGEDHRRLTLTPRALCGSEVVAFLAAGPEKAQAVRRLLAGDSDIPASRIRGRRATYLFCDPAAASLAS